MIPDGHYRGRGKYDDGGGLHLEPSDSVRYETLLDALTDNETYERSDVSKVVLRYADGKVVEIFVNGSCCRDTSTFTYNLQPACPTCNEQHHHDGPLHTVGDLATLWGAPVTPIPQEMTDPIRAEQGRKQIREKLEALKPHLDELAQPRRREVWLAEHGAEEGLHIPLLNAMISTGSVLDEHRDAARHLARDIAEGIRPFLEELEKDARMAHAAGFVETVLELAEL